MTRSFFSFLLSLAASGLTLPTPSWAQSSSNGIAAVVNGRVITESEVTEAVKAQEQIFRMQMREDPEALNKALAELEGSALDSLIDRELILEEFKKIGGAIKPQYVDDDIESIIRDSFNGDRDAFITELARTGMTMRKFRDLREKMIIVQVMRGRATSEQPPPTPRDVQQFYQDHMDEFREGDMIKISTITIPKFTGDPTRTPEDQKRLAEDVRSKVLAGADFAATARSYSQDSRSEAGGEWPLMERTQMKKSIADAAFGVKEGGISPVLVDEAAYIIISVDAKKYGDAKPLEELRPQIERRIRQQKSKEALDSWLEGLRRKATIRRFE
ncbi:MAG: SurA N-terminal domain-containing protein [Verrucomicrobiales bacterium]|nr:SurA N-terminal domain-containing protein [Verrucomicrobiales bacterium]